MPNPFLSEIRMFSFGFPPKGWALCNGQFLPINQNQALFALLGTTYGGNGQTTFALPNLQGRVPMHMGNGHTLGEAAGQQAHTITVSELPQHTHSAVGSSDQATLAAAAGNLWGKDASAPFAPNSNVAMNPGSLVATGGSQPHENMSPYQVINFCIALQGIFPSQN